MMNKTQKCAGCNDRFLKTELYGGIGKSNHGACCESCVSIDADQAEATRAYRTAMKDSEPPHGFWNSWLGRMLLGYKEK